jgi:hypothetical protein
LDVQGTVGINPFPNIRESIYVFVYGTTMVCEDLQNDIQVFLNVEGVCVLILFFETEKNQKDK